MDKNELSLTNFGLQVDQNGSKETTFDLSPKKWTKIDKFQLLSANMDNIWSLLDMDHSKILTSGGPKKL
jgi:hypothetical protein